MPVIGMMPMVMPMFSKIWKAKIASTPTARSVPKKSDDNNAEIDASVFDLLTVFQKIMARHVDEIKMEIHREEISLADMIKEMRRRILEQGELSLLSVFEEMRSKRELVTAFIAVLEIVRTEGVRLFQNTTFGDVILRKV